MNAERQIIGSLLLDSTRIDDIHLISPEMFTESVLGDIFNLYKTDRNTDALAIIAKLKSDFMTEQMLTQLISDLVTEHDAAISDNNCEELIFNQYRSQRVNEVLNKTLVNPQNIDKAILELEESLESFKRPPEKTKYKTLGELAAYKSDYFVEHERSNLKIGFAKLDEAIGGLDNGDVSVIAARPAVGKSAFSLQMIRNFGKSGFKVGYFNLEMSEKQIYERTIAATSGIDMTRIRMATTFLNDEKEKFDKGNEKLAEENNVVTIFGTQTIDSIRAIQKVEQFQVIVIDYMQLIKSTRQRNNRASEVGDISRGLKAIATDFNIHVIALSQLNRSSEMLKDKEPFMSELRESGDIEQDASVIMMLWNTNSEDLSEKKIKVEKSRNGYCDKIPLYFDGKHMTFSTINVEKSGDFHEAPKTQEEEINNLWS